MSHHQLLFVSAGGGGEVKLFSGTIQKLNSIDPQDAYAGIRYNKSGIYPRQHVSTTALTWSSVDTWCLQGIPSDFQFRAQVLSGSTPLGYAVNTWITADVSSGPQWYLWQSNIGQTACGLFIEARLTSNQTVIASSYLTLRVVVS